MSLNLATKLREGTTKSHSMAENVMFVKSFLSGVIDRQAYRKLVANLYFVYCAIEKEMMVNQEHPCIKPIYFTELNRKESLEHDLTFFYGSNWKQVITPSTATQIYIDRIYNISKEQPELLVAHAYTRYLGDLSGGQILKKIAKNAMNLSSTEGTQFYDFNLIEDEKSFKYTYRNALDSIPVNDMLMKDIIAEANIAFSLNMKIFQELDSNFIKIMVGLLRNVMSSFKNRK
uniref:Heme oxygenase n=1 Tax=Bangiopsis subsimplex TaxID=139980 RepID=A0A1C9CCZ4_9RHOD|nr:heme oxygenase [Bangiopsis subsimplex]AOM66214.1 heme oxygenase [Bangiopsis subsimplex]ARO90425.1 heme oxygenase [Bangiopsis subsimplex]